MARWIDETLPNEATSNDPPDAGGGSDGEALIDLSVPHQRVQPNGPILANGKAFARIHITVLDPSGAPVPGAEVTLESDRNDGLLLTQPSESTNAAGITSGYAKSIDGGDYELTARITHEGQTVALNNTGTLGCDDCLSTPDLYRIRLRPHPVHLHRMPQRIRPCFGDRATVQRRTTALATQMGTRQRHHRPQP